MMCQPNCVCTGSEIWPTSSAKAASSKGFNIWPLPKKPRSPPSALGSFDFSLATVAKSSPFFSRSAISFASASVLDEDVARVDLLLRLQALDLLVIDLLGLVVGDAVAHALVVIRVTQRAAPVIFEPILEALAAVRDCPCRPPPP